MTLLATITDAALGFPYTFPAKFETRTACRAFLFDAEGRIAYMHNGAKNHYKLPGGGLEGTETLEQTLTREMREEAGCNIHNATYLGYVEEHRGKNGFLQTSHLYRAEVLGPKGEPQFDAGEQAENFTLHWLTPQEAIARLKADPVTNDYNLTFMNAREQRLLSFLK